MNSQILMHWMRCRKVQNTGVSVPVESGVSHSPSMQMHSGSQPVSSPNPVLLGFNGSFMTLA